MATLRENVQIRTGELRNISFDSSQFVRENITKSWLLTFWLLVLSYITVRFVVGQFQESPAVTGIVLAIWALTVAWTVVNELTHHHSAVTRWLRGNLYSSITNILITLLLALMVLAAIRGFWDYAVTRASFTTDAEQAAETLGQFEDPGANWGAVVDNMRNLMVFRYPSDQDWRIYASLAIFFGLLLASIIVYRNEKYRGSKVRSALTILWVLSPLAIFFLLWGVEVTRILAVLGIVAAVAIAFQFIFRPGAERSTTVRAAGIAAFVVILFVALYLMGILIGGSDKINPEQFWGGLLLTIIISVFAITVSFPIGVLLALGRRSTVRGIPAWLIWIIIIPATVYFFLTSTQANLEVANTTFQTLISYWPLLLPVFGYLFIRYFNGNVIALTSTVWIEVWRGVPFITVLFMSIILFPIFLPPGVEILGTWRVMVAAAFFASAYLAENVRGGLQSIPNGQYEAADALGLGTYSKYRLIILPQAIRTVIPAIVGQFIGLWKDTTLVAIVGLIDLLGAANLISAQPDWLGVRREPYIFVIVIFFIGSWIMASYSRRLERQLGVGER